MEGGGGGDSLPCRSISHGAVRPIRLRDPHRDPEELTRTAVPDLVCVGTFGKAGDPAPV